MGPRKVVVLAALLALALFAPPARAAAPDGAFITAGGSYYRIVGGSAMRVGSCAPLGGCAGAALDNPAAYLATPRDGTFLRVQNGPREGLIVRFAGGAAIGLGTCAPLAGCPGATGIDNDGFAAYEAAHPRVADGTFVRVANGALQTLVARAAGGALIGLGSCAALGNCTGYVDVDETGFLTYTRAHPTIADGTFVRRPDGAIARVVGGAILGMSSCAQLNDCAGWVQLDDAGFNGYAAAHPTIADGTFVRVITANGPLFARAAGGRLLFVTDCGALGGCPGDIAIDQTSSTTYQNAHPLVADGTVLRGQPSGRVVRIVAGVRRTIADPGSAIDVNDATFAQFADGDPATLPAVRDADGDGVSSPLDCDDARADVHPGAVDTPGDGIDQDCSGADAVYPKLDLLVGAFFNTRGSRTNLTSFYVRSVPAGTRLTLRCTGGGCPFKSKVVTVEKATARLSLLTRVKDAKLRTGARLELTIAHEGMVGKVIRWTIRKGKNPLRSNLCLAPGAKQAKSCSAAQ